MEIIQVQVSSELAQRLRPYQNELPRILEWGLRHVERERETEAESPTPPTREEVLAALRSTGLLVELDPAIVTRYREGEEKQRRHYTNFRPVPRFPRRCATVPRDNDRSPPSARPPLP